MLYVDYMHYAYVNNLINNKVYVGQTNKPSLRWFQYKSNVKYKVGKMLITKAMIKHGLSAFDFKVVANSLVAKEFDAHENTANKTYVNKGNYE